MIKQRKKNTKKVPEKSQLKNNKVISKRVETTKNSLAKRSPKDPTRNPIREQEAGSGKLKNEDQLAKIIFFCGELGLELLSLLCNSTKKRSLQ